MAIVGSLVQGIEELPPTRGSCNDVYLVHSLGVAEVGPLALLTPRHHSLVGLVEDTLIDIDDRFPWWR